LSAIAEYERSMRRRNLSPATINRRIPLLRALEQFINAPSVLDACTSVIEMFLDTRHRVCSDSRGYYLSDIRCFFEWARIHELVAKNPASVDLIPPPQREKHLPRPILEPDLGVAIDAADRLMHAWLALGAYAGLRCMEIAQLRTTDVLWHESHLRVRGKGRKERLVPMHPFLADTLEQWHVPRHGPVFQRPFGGRWANDGVSRKISSFFADLGMDWTAHNLRHRFGTKTYEACKDIRVVQELMGHSSPTTTAIYAAYSRVEARAAVLALPLTSTPTPNDEAA
jgi:integrase/recombinase XerC